MVGGPVCLKWLGALGRVVALREVLDETCVDQGLDLVLISMEIP